MTNPATSSNSFSGTLAALLVFAAACVGGALNLALGLLPVSPVGAFVLIVATPLVFLVVSVASAQLSRKPFCFKLTAVACGIFYGAAAASQNLSTLGLAAGVHQIHATMHALVAAAVVTALLVARERALPLFAVATPLALGAAMLSGQPGVLLSWAVAFAFVATVVRLSALLGSSIAARKQLA
jgi:hypothetical protein